MGFAYSTRIWAGQVVVGTTKALAAVPPGKRLVVRSIYNQQTSGAGTYLAIRVQPANVQLLRVAPSGADYSTLWEGHLVIHELENISLIATISAANISIHGYLLDGAGGPMNPSPLFGGDGQPPEPK